MLTKRVLITGGTGFCGYWMQMTQPMDNNFVWYLHHSEYENVQWENGVWDYIVHLAPISPVNVLDYAREHGSKVLFASSGAVYGDRLDYKEYGDAKRHWEELCLNSGVDVVIARLFTFIGKNLKNRYAITHFVENAKQGKPIEVWGDGSSVRSYLYGEDLGRWMWKLLFDGNGCYDVGGSQDYTILGVARIVSMITGAEINMVHPEHVEDYYVPVVDRAKRLGCEETIGLWEAIEKVVNDDNSE